VGIEAMSVYDLVNSQKSYPQAVPVLIEALERGFHSIITEGIVRSLTDPAAKGVAVDPLLRVFLSTKGHSGPDSSLKWAIGNAMLAAGTPKDYDKIVTIVKDKKHGSSRQNFVVWLGKAKKRRWDSIPVLRSLLKQDDVVAHALIAIRKLKLTELRKAVKQLTTHERPLVRREAAKALAVLDAEVA
jgi:HEAT repeat protein